MTNVIYDYPKSSCDCYECTRDKYEPARGVPTNMSVRGCQYASNYDCFPRTLTKVQEEPRNLNGFDILSPEIPKKLYPYMQKINPDSTCAGVTYINSDPRLYNAYAATWLRLDTPPMYSAQKIDTLPYNNNLYKYGQDYSSYADIDGGNIMYYIDKSIEDPLFNPLFSKKSAEISTLYKDPMGNFKPEYARIPIGQGIGEYNPIINNTNTENSTTDYCLSSMRDTQYQREDILALQMRKNNQTRYSSRWT
jgi:hypothetical protein